MCIRDRGQARARARDARRRWQGALADPADGGAASPSGDANRGLRLAAVRDQVVLLLRREAPHDREAALDAARRHPSA
eukprot:5107168-Prymnesium_polylepis.1